MNFMKFLAPLALMLLSACVNPVNVVQPISASLQNQVNIAEVDVTLSSLAQTAMQAFETKAREKRAAAGLPPVDPAAAVTTRPGQAEYATLPFARMFELVVQDVTRQRGLTAGRPVKLAVQIDTLKTANAGMAMLLGSSDQLAGTVRVLDAQSGQQLGEFYVDVINSHSGLLGLAMRGGGIREELSEEFAIHIARQLTGKKS